MVQQYMIKYPFELQGRPSTVGEIFFKLDLRKHLLSIQIHFTRNKCMCFYNMIVEKKKNTHTK